MMITMKKFLKLLSVAIAELILSVQNVRGTTIENTTRKT